MVNLTVPELVFSVPSSNGIKSNLPNAQLRMNRPFSVVTNPFTRHTVSLDSVLSALVKMLSSTWVASSVGVGSASEESLEE